MSRANIHVSSQLLGIPSKWLWTLGRIPVLIWTTPSPQKMYWQKNPSLKKTNKFATFSKKKARWWFQIFFIFIPIWGKWSNLTCTFFEMGWFNHQLEKSQVMGCAFLLGGLKFPTQKFSQPGAATQCSLMALILGRGNRILRLMATRSPEKTHQLRLVGVIPFIHFRWLALGVLNHQQ